MKTRIKIVEYADGTKRYIAQEKNGFFEYFSREFDEHPFITIWLGIILVPVLFIVQFFWQRIGVYNEDTIETEDEFDSMDEAKQAVDLHIAKIENKKQYKLLEKKRNKVVSKTYLKYP